MEDVPRIVTAEYRARTYSTPTTDHIGPIRTGRHATTLAGTIPRAVAANNPPPYRKSPLSLLSEICCRRCDGDGLGTELIPPFLGRSDQTASLRSLD
jgi:hypothetical protein